MDGMAIYRNVEDTNRYYGGRNISVTKVVFPNGSIDPWHAMGVTQDISSDATAIYINGKTNWIVLIKTFIVIKCSNSSGNTGINFNSECADLPVLVVHFIDIEVNHVITWMQFICSPFLL